MRKTTYFLLYFLICLFSINESYSQVSRYSFSTEIGNYQAISGGTAVSINSDDSISSVINIGFTFNYSGVNYTQLKMSSNGFITFGTTTASINTNGFSNLAEDAKPLIAPLWDDLSGSTTGAAKYIVTGSAPNRVMTLEWGNWKWNYGASANISFQVKLYETTNVIEFVYNTSSTVSVNNGSATIGLGGLPGTTEYLNVTSTSSPAVSSTTQENNISTKPINNSVYRFTPPSCTPVGNFALNSASQDGGIISWAQSTGNTSSYEYEIRTSGLPGTPGAIVSGTLTGNSLQYVASGLAPSTTYYFHIKRICSATDQTGWTSYSFTTLCGLISTLPYVENFDNHTTGIIPNCWTRSGIYNGYPSIVASNSYTSPNSLRFNSQNSSNPNYVISPAFTENIRNLKVSFWLKREGSSSGTMQVGVMSDPTNLLTFELVQTINPSDNNYAFYEIELNNVVMSGGNRHIAIRQNTTSSLWYYWLDDFKVEKIPTCFAPTNLNSGSLAFNSALLSWTPSVRNSSASYFYELRTSGLPGSGSVGLVNSGPIASGNQNFNATNLEDDQEYFFYIKSVCGTNDESLWETVSFRTLCIYPTFVSSTPGSVCGQGQVSLSANFGANTSIRWYDAATGGTMLGEGNTFQTPVINQNTTYYAEGSFGNGISQASIGNGTSNASGYGQNPFYRSWGGLKTQYVFTAQELLANGLTSGNITSLALEIITAGDNLNNFSIAMGNTTITNFTTADFQTNLITVYSGASQTTSTGLKEYVFNQPFNWDGSSNIIVQIAWSNSDSGGSSPIVKYTTTSANKAIYYRVDNTTITAILNSTTITSRTSAHPNIIFKVLDGCTNPTRQAVVATVTPPPTLTLSNSNITICKGEASNAVTITAGASNYTNYTVTPTTGVTGNATTGWIFNPTLTTRYTLTATQNSGNMCTNVIYIDVTVNDTPVITTNINEINACANEIVALTSTETGLNRSFTFGTGTSTSGDYDTSSPFYCNYGGVKTQILYLASELTTQGFVAGQRINSLAVDVTSSRDVNFMNFTIRMGHTTNVNMSNLVPSTGLTTLYQATLNAANTPLGLRTFNFTTPFVWDGVSNVVVEFVHNDGTYGNGVNGLKVRYSTTPFVSTRCHYGDGIAGGLAGIDNNTPTNSSTSNNRINVVFSGAKNYTTTWSPATNLYTDANATQPYVAGNNTANVYFKSSNGIQNGEFSVIISSEDGCSTEKIIDVNVNLVEAPTVSRTNYCLNATLEDVEVNGSSVKWYESLESTTVLPLTTEIDSGTTYFVSQTLNGCESVKTAVTINLLSTDAPVSINTTQEFCIHEGGTVADLLVNGTDVKWYTSETDNVVLAGNTPLQNTATYYASQTLNLCESIERTPLTVLFTAPDAPELVNSVQLFCVNNIGTVSDLVVNGQSIKWYETDTSTIVLEDDVQLEDGKTYYASQTINGCESVDKTGVTVEVIYYVEPPFVEDSTQYLCAQNNPTIADIQVDGLGIKWYATETSTVVLDSSTAVVSGNTYYASQTITGCESEDRVAVTVEILDLEVPTTTETVQLYCEIEQITFADLQAEGLNVRWYNQPVGGTMLDNTEIVQSGFYYGVQTLNGCESEQRLEIGVEVIPTSAPVAQNQVLCNVNTPKVSDLVAQGENLKWYSSSDSTTALDENELLINGTYYVTQTINGCESLNRTSIQVVISDAQAPVGVLSYTFCSSEYKTFRNLSIQGSNLKWYNSLTSNDVIDSSTLLSTGAFYVTQTINGCESSTRTRVDITIEHVDEITQTNVAVCSGSMLRDIVIQGHTYQSLRWYSSLTSTVTLNLSTAINRTGTYFLEIVEGNCISQRRSVMIEILPQIGLPNVNSVVYICGSGTIQDIEIFGAENATIEWFGNQTSQVVLAPNATLNNGTYYVSQRIGNCSSQRKPVSVIVMSRVAPTYTTLNVCEGTKISEVTWSLPTGAVYEWYTTPTSQALPSNTVLTSGVYYVARSQYGCISEKSRVTVTVNQVPNAPTGDSIQTLEIPATISDIVMNESGIIWYNSYNNAINNTGALSNLTTLIDGNTYYGVIQNVSGCRSLPTAVTINLFLSDKDFDVANFKVYPNPTSDFINITYKDIIEEIEVFNVLGQKVLSGKIDDTDAKIDLSNFATGTYMVRVKVNNNIHLVKVVKTN